MPKHRRFGGDDENEFEDNNEEEDVENEEVEDESTAPFKGNISLEFSDSDEAPESISLGEGKALSLQKLKQEKDLLKQIQKLEKEKRQKYSSKKVEDDVFEQEQEFIGFDQEDDAFEEDEEDEEIKKIENFPSNLRVKTIKEVVENTSKKNESVEQAINFMQQRLYGARVSRANTNDFRARKRIGNKVYNFSVKKRKLLPRK